MAEKSAPLRVLVVDDEALIRWSLAETLESAGHIVAEAGDAASAVQLLSASAVPFDVVVLDYRLPDSDDLTLLERIRAMSPGSAVIMMTAFGTAELAQGAAARGAYRVVPKPFEVGEMAALVAQASRH